MPKVRQKNDGGYIIKTFKGDMDDFDDGFHGTWQLHGMGETYLEMRRLLYDGASLTVEEFLDLAAYRLIWSESGGYPVPRREMSSEMRATLEAPTLSRVQPSKAAIPTNRVVASTDSVGPLGFLSIHVALIRDRSTLKPSLVLDGGPQSAETIARMEAKARRNANTTLQGGGESIRLNQPVRNAVFNLLSWISVDTADVKIEFVQRKANGSLAREVVARIKGVRQAGSLFGLDGFRVMPDVNRLSGRSFHLLIHKRFSRSVDDDILVPAALAPTFVSSRKKWEVYRITMPAAAIRPGSAEAEFLTGLVLRTN